MNVPRTVHFQRSFSQVAACDGHLGGPNTLIPEEVTCPGCWEVVKDQARRRGELERVASERDRTWPETIRQNAPGAVLAEHALKMVQATPVCHLLMPNALAACGKKPGVAGGSTDLNEVTCQACLVNYAERHLQDIDHYHAARADKCSYELMERLIAALKEATK